MAIVAHYAIAIATHYKQLVWFQFPGITLKKATCIYDSVIVWLFTLTILWLCTL
jgi:hypothetical protein